MTDQEKLEKVIAELERVADEANPWKESPPLRCDISYPLLIDAITLLKAQEPVKPTVEHNYAGQPMWCCGNCGTTLFFKFHKQTDDEDERNNYRFCSYCGMKVKWE